MSLYLDTSALAKLYIEEEWSFETSERVRQEPTAVTTLLARVELPGAIAKAMRIGALDREDADRLNTAFERDWPDYFALPVTSELVLSAAAITVIHALRAYDAVHLASALSWRRQSGAPVTFATFDRHLWRAAQAEHLDPWPEKLAE